MPATLRSYAAVVAASAVAEFLPRPPRPPQARDDSQPRKLDLEADHIKDISRNPDKSTHKETRHTSIMSTLAPGHAGLSAEEDRVWEPGPGHSSSVPESLAIVGNASTRRSDPGDIERYWALLQDSAHERLRLNIPSDRFDLRPCRLRPASEKNSGADDLLPSHYIDPMHDTPTDDLDATMLRRVRMEALESLEMSGYLQADLYGERRSRVPMATTPQSAPFIPDRISYSFGSSGPSVSVDTACSSSLFTVHAACKNPWQGEGEKAIEAGAEILSYPENFVDGERRRAASRRPFESSADGYSRADATSFLALKRYQDAVVDEDLSEKLWRERRAYESLRQLADRESRNIPSRDRLPALHDRRQVDLSDLDFTLLTINKMIGTGIFHEFRKILISVYAAMGLVCLKDIALRAFAGLTASGIVFWIMGLVIGAGMAFSLAEMRGRSLGYLMAASKILILGVVFSILVFGQSTLASVSACDTEISPWTFGPGALLVLYANKPEWPLTKIVQGLSWISISLTTLLGPIIALSAKYLESYRSCIDSTTTQLRSLLPEIRQASCPRMGESNHLTPTASEHIARLKPFRAPASLYRLIRCNPGFAGN